MELSVPPRLMFLEPEPAKKSFSQRRKDRRKGRKAVLQKNEFFGFASRRIAEVSLRPRHATFNAAFRQSSHPTILLCCKTALRLCADLCVFARNSFLPFSTTHNYPTTQNLARWLKIFEFRL